MVCAGETGDKTPLFCHKDRADLGWRVWLVSLETDQRGAPAVVPSNKLMVKVGPDW